MACLADLYSSLYVPTVIEGKGNEEYGPSNLTRQFKAEMILNNFDPHSCSSRTAKSDVDYYLNLPFVVDHDGFIFLSTRRHNLSYPTVALMARDIVAIPVTSVAS
ncbi:Zinc finger BED domain-containing protein DAYSLEEPER [Bienertia sinuspersici]